MPDANIDTTVTDDGDRVTIELPPGSSHAALALRIQAGSDEHVRHVLLGLADRFAAVVMEFNAAMDDAGPLGAADVRIVTGAEAIAAFDVAAMQTAAAMGLERPGHHIAYPDPAALGDHMRRHFARGMGLNPHDLLPWDQLKGSEQQTWLGHANSAIEFMAQAA